MQSWGKCWWVGRKFSLCMNRISQRVLLILLCLSNLCLWKTWGERRGIMPLLATALKIEAPWVSCDALVRETLFIPTLGSGTKSSGTKACSLSQPLPVPGLPKTLLMQGGPQLEILACCRGKKWYCAWKYVREAHITSAKREVPCGRGPGPA